MPGRELLERFRPASAPGAVGRVGVPSDVHEDAEVLAVLSALAPSVAQAEAVREQARQDAHALVEETERQAQAIRARARLEATEARAAAAAQPVRPAGARASDSWRRPRHRRDPFWRRPSVTSQWCAGWSPCFGARRRPRARLPPARHSRRAGRERRLGRRQRPGPRHGAAPAGPCRGPSTGGRVLAGGRPGTARLPAYAEVSPPRPAWRRRNERSPRRCSGRSGCWPAGCPLPAPHWPGSLRPRSSARTWSGTSAALPGSLRPLPSTWAP